MVGASTGAVAAVDVGADTMLFVMVPVAVTLETWLSGCACVG